MTTLQDHTFASLFDAASRSHASQYLVVDARSGERLTYAETFARTLRAADRLWSSGFGAGDIVLSYAALNLDTVILCWACLLNGCVFVPVDHHWPRSLLLHVIEETTPNLILVDEQRQSFLPPNNAAWKVLLTGKITHPSETPTFNAWLEQSGAKHGSASPTVGSEDRAVILYTSGSTGKPKGVVLSHRALYRSGRLVAEHFEWMPGDLFMNLGDLHSMSGLRNTCLAPLHSGSACVLAAEEERNNPLAVLDLVHRLKVAFIGIAPIIIRQLNVLSSPARKDLLCSLKAVLCTGGSLAPDQLSQFFEHYGKPVLNYYGLTETGGICAGHSLQTFNPTDAGVGPALGAELILAPQDHGPQTDTGELLVRSDQLMSGYHGRPEETATVLRDGYFHTGDIARRRADGCYELIGRKNNIVKTLRSELLHLEELDRALEACPGVAESSTCRHVRTPDDERIVAFVVLRQNETDPAEQVEAIKRFLEERVGKHRMPWRYFIEQALPRNSAGKVLRTILEQKADVYLRTKHLCYF